MSEAQAHNPESQLSVTKQVVNDMALQADPITPMEILSQAVEKGQSVEVLERLMALQERWEANQARRAFDNAMANLGANLPRILKVKHKNGPVYEYEDLGDLTDDVRAAMSPHGLSFRWRTDDRDPKIVRIGCLISHKDGHSETTWLSGRPDNGPQRNEMQALGSATTYLQRYTLKAAVGVAASRDDDARCGRQPIKTEPQRLSKANSRDLYKELQGDIDAADSKDALEVWIKERKTDIDKLPEDHLQYLRERYAEKMNDFITKNEGLDYDQYGQYQ